MKQAMFGWLVGLTVAAMAAPAAAQTMDSTNQSPQTDVESILGGMEDDQSACAPSEADKEQVQRELEAEYIQRMRSNGQVIADAWRDERMAEIFESRCPGG